MHTPIPQADLYADNIIFRRLRACSAAESASSEETTDIVPLEGSGYSVGAPTGRGVVVS